MIEIYSLLFAHINLTGWAIIVLSYSSHLQFFHYTLLFLNFSYWWISCYCFNVILLFEYYVEHWLRNLLRWENFREYNFHLDTCFGVINLTLQSGCSYLKRLFCLVLLVIDN